MLKKPDQQAFLNKILSDPIFAKSETYNKILKYLVKCSKQNKIPNEIEIATNVLGKDKTFDPSEDTLVRVYIYKLRKKLEEYYNQAGKNDKIRLTIPKGHYHVVFKSISAEKKIQKSRPSISFKRLLFASFILSLILLNIYQWNNKAIQQRLDNKVADHINLDNFLWGDFLSSKLPTIITFGNLFTFYEYRKNLDRIRLVRDDMINTNDELEQFISFHSLNPDEYSIPDWEIVPKSSIWNLFRLQPLFTNRKKDFKLRTTNEIEWSDIKNYNLVYIGHFHNLNILNEIYPSLHFKHIETRHRLNDFRYIKVRDQKIDTTYTFIDSGLNLKKFVTDYVILSKVPGPQNNVFLFIISFHQTGRIEVVKKITDNTLLEQLKEKIIAINNSIPDYFEMLLEVKGFEQTAMVTEIKHFYEISSDFHLKHNIVHPVDN